MSKNNYVVVVGNIGTMKYTSKKLAEDCYTTYVNLSKNNETRAAGEPVTLFKNGVITKEYTPCKLRELLNFETCKQLVEQAITSGDTCAILCSHYSINISSKYENGEELQFDLDELSTHLGHYISVSDYDDLIVSLVE